MRQKLVRLDQVSFMQGTIQWSYISIFLYVLVYCRKNVDRDAPTRANSIMCSRLSLVKSEASLKSDGPCFLLLKCFPALDPYLKLA